MDFDKEPATNVQSHEISSISNPSSNEPVSQTPPEAASHTHRWVAAIIIGILLFSVIGVGLYAYTNLPQPLG